MAEYLFRVRCGIMSAVFLAAAVFSSCSGEYDESVQTEITSMSVINAGTTGTTETTGTTITSAAETEASSETEPAIRLETVTFTAVGDNLIHSSIYKQAAKRAAEENSSEEYDFTYAYEGVSDLLDKADITFINQETLICNDIFEPSTYPRFNSPTELGEHMTSLGADVFGMANNHVLDMGTDGLAACLDYYDENDIIRVGAYRDSEDRENIRIVEKNGVKTAFLAYTESTNGLVLPSDSTYNIGMIASMEQLEEAAAEIALAKEQADICVVSLHWGVENSDTVSDYQRQTARMLGNAGADIIIGTHPHVLREIERFTNDDGSETLCAYSLGNFISAQNVGRNLIGGVLNFSVTADVSDIPPEERKKPVISDVEFIPVITHYDYGYSNVRLYKLSDYTKELASAHGVNKYSEFGYDFIYDYLEKHGLDEYMQ